MKPDNGCLHLVLFLFVAAVAVTIGLVVASELGFGTEHLNQICELRAGEHWRYVNGSHSYSNHTIACQAPNGSTTRVSGILNATA